MGRWIWSLDRWSAQWHPLSSFATNNLLAGTALHNPPIPFHSCIPLRPLSWARFQQNRKSLSFNVIPVIWTLAHPPGYCFNIKETISATATNDHQPPQLIDIHTLSMGGSLCLSVVFNCFSRRRQIVNSFYRHIINKCRRVEHSIPWNYH